MNRGDAEAQRLNALTEQIIGAAIEVHRVVGPGLLESIYELCLCRELGLRNLTFQRQVEVPVEYKGLRLETGFRLDLIVDEAVIVELKTVDSLAPIHSAGIADQLSCPETDRGHPPARE